MATTTNLNIRIDSEIKERAEVFFADLGMSFTTAVNIFVRQALKQGKIPFEIRTECDPFYSASNMAVLERSLQESREGKVIFKTMDELRAME